MSALATLLWAIPVVASFSLLLLLIRSQDRFASVARSGWARVITGAVLLVLFSLTLFLLHLPIVEMLLGSISEWVVLVAYLLFAAGLLLMVPAAVGWLADLSLVHRQTEDRISAVSLTEDLVSVSEQPFVLTELLTAGLGVMMTHAHVQGGMIWLLAPDGVTLILAGSKGFEKPALKAAESVVASGHELLDRALKGRQVITAGELASRGRFMSTFPGMEAFGSAAVVPLSAGGEIIAMAFLAARESYHFDPVLIRAMEGAGRVLGSAVAAQRLQRHIQKLQKDKEVQRRALDYWDRTLGGSMPATVQSLLHGLQEAAGACAAFLSPVGSRHIPYATEPTLVGLPMDGIWGEAVVTAEKRQRALWVNTGGRSNDPRSSYGKWVVLPTPAGLLFFVPSGGELTLSVEDLARLGRAAEIALLIAPRPDLPEPEHLFDLAARICQGARSPEALVEAASDLAHQAEAVLVWRKEQGRLRVVATGGCDADALAGIDLPVGQGAVGKAALAVQPLCIESSAELGRSWAEYSEEDRAAFAEAFGGFDRPAAEYVVPLPQAGLVLHLVRFTRGGWSEATMRLVSALARAFESDVSVSAADAASSPMLTRGGGAAVNELNNVFTGIIGQAELLGRQLQEFGLPVLEKERIERILSAAQAGSDLVKHLAEDVPDEGHPGLDILTADLLAGRHITDDLYLLPDNRAIQIAVRFEETPAFVPDREKLQVVLWKALARVARDRGKVSLTTSADDQYTYLAVGNTEGTEPLKGPFGDFFRAPDHKWRDVLAMEDLDFLRSVGAQLACDQPESPRRLVVRFPLREQVSARDGSRAGLNVLAIDDQEIIRDLLLNMFMGMGHRIKVCKSGEEGLKAMEHEPFDLVLTDLGMPGMSGWEVAQAVKERRPDVPVVLITGWGFNFAEEQVRRAGVDYVLTKPFRLEHLTEVVEAAVRRAPQVR